MRKSSVFRWRGSVVYCRTAYLVVTCTACECDVPVSQMLLLLFPMSPIQVEALGQSFMLMLVASGDHLY